MVKFDEKLTGHKCTKIAEVHTCGDGREIWVGRLDEPIPDFEHETHCIHVTTPLKDEQVFAVWRGDMFTLMAICEVIRADAIGQDDPPINYNLVRRRSKLYREKAQVTDD